MQTNGINMNAFPRTTAIVESYIFNMLLVNRSTISWTKKMSKTLVDEQVCWLRVCGDPYCAIYAIQWFQIADNCALLRDRLFAVLEYIFQFIVY